MSNFIILVCIQMKCTASVAIKCALALVQGEGGGFKFVLNDIPFLCLQPSSSQYLNIIKNPEDRRKVVLGLLSIN